MSNAQKRKTCRKALNPFSGWDISRLTDKGGNLLNKGKGECKGTVWFNGNCYGQTKANYYLWGIGRRLCGDSYTTAKWTAGVWKGAAYFHSLSPETEGFIRAGWMNTSSIRSCHKGCRKPNEKIRYLDYHWGEVDFWDAFWMAIKSVLE